MPNWCSNSLKIIGPTDAVAAFVNECSTDGKLDFQKLVPMPDILDGTVSPTPEWLLNLCKLYVGVEDGSRSEAMDEIAKEHPDWKEEIEKLMVRVRDTGSTNWYDWRIVHWGTKWNATDTGRDDDGNILFSTASSPPLPVILKMGTLHPEWRFELKYAEDGMCIRGEYFVEGGEVVLDQYEDYDPEDGDDD